MCGKKININIGETNIQTGAYMAKPVFGLAGKVNQYQRISISIILISGAMNFNGYICTLSKAKDVVRLL